MPFKSHDGSLSHRVSDVALRCLFGVSLAWGNCGTSSKVADNLRRNDANETSEKCVQVQNTECLFGLVNVGVYFILTQWSDQYLAQLLGNVRTVHQWTIYRTKLFKRAAVVHYGNQSRGYLMRGGPLWPPAVPRLAARPSQSNPRGSGPEVLKRERGHVTSESGVA